MKLNNLMKVKEAALSCVHCGQCRVANWPEKNYYYVCPVYKTDCTPNFEPFFARGKNLLLKGLFWGDLELSSELSEIIFQCSLCGACEDFCHNSHNEYIDFANGRWMEQVISFEALRADLVEAGYGLDSHNSMNDALMTQLNPYQRNNDDKNTWKTDLNFQIKDLTKEHAEVLYFVGCTAAFTPQIQTVARTTAKILHILNIDFGIFGQNEVCCGSVAVRTGNRKAFNKVASLNVRMFKEYNIKTIITSCAGCYRTLKKDYGDLLEDIQIFHTAEYLEKILKNKDIELKNRHQLVTYHDPCHLGRHSGVYDTPRNILNKISNLVEMKTHREASMCCGAGGGLKKAFPDLSLEMAKNRVKEAEETQAKYLVSTCPFCFRNLSEAIEVLNSGLKMKDLVELFLEALE
ncbi:MAG: putative CoB--CoM heterodisulfide reductase 2 iron-sulfur subunit D [Promethearchaeota archaeon]|nr:MAG: putative CoB--CoM heterodisulfide reductase 2 iron-sulfur subunit D [Candidatus Lokiarchaeota archaeon]